MSTKHAMGRRWAVSVRQSEGGRGGRGEKEGEEGEKEGERVRMDRWMESEIKKKVGMRQG